MGDAVDRLGSWMLDAGVSASAWLCLVMLAMIACRQPIRRRDLARAGIIGALAVLPLSAASMDRIAIPIEGVGLPGLIGSRVCERAAGLIPEGIGRLLTIGYVGLASAGVCWSLLGAWAMRRLVKSSASASRETMRLYDRLSFEGRGGRPAVGVSGRVKWPVLVGGRRPTIVIPSDWDRPEPGAVERLRLGLLHELAHAERHDPMFHWLAGLTQAVWFAAPPAWWLRRQLRVDQEILADDRAARCFGETSSSYAASLVDTAAGQSIANRPGPASGETGPAIDPDGSPLVQRVAMLVRCPFPVESRSPVVWRWGMPMLAAFVVLFVSRLTVVGVSLPPVSDRTDMVPFSFELSELEIFADPGDRPIRLPAPLADHFELELDLYADPESLGAISIAGVRLAEPAGTGSESRPVPEAWQRIRIIKDGTEAWLWIDDRSVRAVVDPTADPRWLTVRPAAGRSLRIRNLVLVPLRIEEEPGAATEVTASRAPSEDGPETR